MAQEYGSFVEFPDRDGILERLRAIEIYQTTMEGVFHLTADRLASRAYDRSAFVFILLELIYELPENETIALGDLLGRMVFALTQDLDLVGEALETFDEIRVTLAPDPAPAEKAPVGEPEIDAAKRSVPASGGPGAERTGDAEVGEVDPAAHAESEDGPWGAEADHEHLMMELQLAQKSVRDSGLSARASIEQALARPTRDNVRQSLREMRDLRDGLLRFDALLRESEQRVLEAIGVLDRGSGPDAG